MKGRKQFFQRTLPMVIGGLLMAGLAHAQAQETSSQTPISKAATQASQSTKKQPQRTPGNTPEAKRRGEKSAPTELQAVVVTGIRESLESAETRKRYAPQIMESIVAQNIGKLPDTNAADALERITGVQVAQDSGEGSTVSIRGLTQIETQLNGNTVFTASGSRTLNFEDIPAGLLSGIDVYKTPTASQIEGGIGGIIDLRTHRPFDFKGFKATATIGATHASIAAQTKPKISGLISNTWDTSIGRFGALLAASYQDRPYAQNYTELNPTDTSTGSLDVNGDGKIDANDVLVYPPGIYYEFSHGHRTRVGINGSLQWQPTKNLEFYLDSYFARFKSIGNFNSVYVDSSASSALNISDLYAGTSTIDAFTTFPGTHDMATGTFGQANVVPQSFSEDFEDKTYDVSFGQKWHDGPFTVNTNLHYARGTHEAPFNELDLHGLVPEFSMDMRSQRPIVDYHGFDLTNPDNFTYADIFWDKTSNTGKLDSFRLDASYDVSSGFVQTVQLGYRYSNRTATNQANSLFMDSAVSGTDYFGQPVSSIPGLVSSKRSTLGPAVTPDANQLRDVAAIFNQFNLGPVPGGDPLQAFDLGERTDAVYLSAVYGTYGAVPTDGNIGVRLVHTKESVSGVLSSNGITSPLNKRSSYYDVLPSFNLTLHLTDNVQWRFAAAKTMTRPDFSQLAPSVFLDALQRTGTAGNADLQPMKATGFDTSLAWYFNNGGYVFGDLFYKKISNSIANTDIVESFDGVAYRIQEPTNADKGKLRGVEVGYQQFFRSLPSWLKGFGVQANYTYVDSSVTGVIPGFPTSLPDLSKNSYNLMLLYDNHDFWGRIAYNWRSAFFASTRASALGTIPIYDDSYGIVDASVGYNITPHITASLDGVNLFNAKRTSYYLRQTLPNELFLNDRRIEADVRVTF